MRFLSLSLEKEIDIHSRRDKSVGSCSGSPTNIYRLRALPRSLLVPNKKEKDSFSFSSPSSISRLLLPEWIRSKGIFWKDQVMLSSSFPRLNETSKMPDQAKFHGNHTDDTIRECNIARECD